MKKLSTILLAVLIGVLCVLSTGAAGDFRFWDFSDEAVVAAWNPSSSTNVEVTPNGARVYGSGDNINFSPDLSDVVLDNYKYVVIEYTGSTYDGRMQFYHNRAGDEYYYLQSTVKIGDDINRHVFDFDAGEIGSGVVNWTGTPNFVRFDPFRGSPEREITIKYIGLFADKAQFDSFGPYIASDFGVYYGDSQPRAIEVVPVNGNVEFTLKLPAKYVFGGDYTVTWNSYVGDVADAMPVTDGNTLTVNTAEAGETYYFATVSYEEGREYKSEPVKVIVCDEDTYNDYAARIADEYGVYRGDATVASVEGLNAAESAVFTVKGDIDYIFGDYTVNWYCNEAPVATGATLTVAPEDINGFAVYKAVVTDTKGNPAYESAEIIVCDEATYNDYLACLADDFGLYRDDTVVSAIEGLNSAVATFSVKGPLDYIFGDYTVAWFCNGTEVSNGKTLKLISKNVDGSAVYYAVVKHAEEVEPVYVTPEIRICNQEKYEQYLDLLADTFYVYCNDEVADANEEIFVGKTTTFKVKGDADYIFNEYNVEWFVDGETVGNAPYLDVTPAKSSSDCVLYKAVVKNAEGTVLYTSNEIKVFYVDEINPAIIYDANTIYAKSEFSSSVNASLVPNASEDKNSEIIRFKAIGNEDVAEFTPMLKGFNVDLSVYKYMVLKVKPTTANYEVQVYHMFNRSVGENQTGPTDKFYQSAKYENTNYQFIKIGLNVKEKDPTATVYTQMRFDYFNGMGGFVKDGSEYVDLEYVAFFTDSTQFEDFVRANEVDVIPDPEGKFWQFENDEEFTKDFFADAEYDNGAKLTNKRIYTANLKTRDKFNLDKYSVVKFIYTADADTNLTVYNNGNIIMSETLSKDDDSATFDFRNIWSGEFGTLEFVVDADITIGAIGFFSNENAANLYEGKASIPTADGEVTYESAKWWSFSDMDVYYKLQATNLDRAFNVNDRVSEEESEGKNPGPNTITFTVKKDGDATISYNRQHMFDGSAINEAEKYPYVVLGYKSDVVEGKKAFLEYIKHDGTTVTIPFVWPAEGDDNYKGRLIKVAEPDDNGYNKLYIDLASLVSIKTISQNDALTVDAEWAGIIESVSFGVENLTAGDEIEIAYINFFEFAKQAKDFSGDICMNPDSLVTATWSTKSIVVADYITVKDMDLEAETINFSINDFARVSRFTLLDLKKNNPSKKVVVDGGDYSLEFYPANVSDDMVTWYYDLEVSFGGEDAGDVYHNTVKNLITEGEYITGVYFHQKFINDRSMPFKGKLIYNIGEEYNDKYLDIYKYDTKLKQVLLVEHAPVKEGKIAISSLGGDLAIVDGGYQPTEEEIKRAEAIELYENTPWAENALIFDFGAASGDSLVLKAGNSKVTTVTKDGVTYRNIEMTGGDRILLTLTPTTPFEASEYPVMVVKYKTSVNLSGAVNNYVTTDYYAAGTGYEWFKNGTYYSATGVYTVAPKWTTKVINYTNADTMRASGFAISGEYTEGKTSTGNVSYPFKGLLAEYRLDFMTSVGSTVDLAYVAFFKNAEEAQKYMDARNAYDGFAEADAKAEEEAANADKPQYYVFDLTNEKEASKYTFAGATEDQPTKTESNKTAEGLWMKDNDGEFNITRLLGGDEQFELSEYPILKIKVKYSIPGVTSQLYVWNTAQEGTHPRCELLVEKAGEFTEQIWDFSKENMALGTWNGVLTKFRLDPMRGAGKVEREATVAYIGFFKTIEDAEAFDGKIEAKK